MDDPPLRCASGRPLGRERYLGPEPAALMVTRDGRELVTTGVDGTVIRDARTLRELRRLPVSAEQACLSPTVRTIPRAGARRLGALRRSRDRAQTMAASGRHDRAVERAIFSPTGAWRSRPAEDGRVIVWDVGHVVVVETLAGHAAKITGLAISSDGSTLYSSSLDSKVLIWDLAGDRRLGRPFKLARMPGSCSAAP